MEKIDVCSQCKQEAPMTKAGKSGHRPYCKPCWNTKRKAWAAARPMKDRGPPPVKACSTCGEVRQMAKSGKHGYRAVCKPCWNSAHKEWRSANKERWAQLHNRYYQKKKSEKPEWVAAERLRGREYWRGLRNAALDAYGRSCACCGETIDEFLSIDHMDNDGAAHRRTLKTKGAGIWKWLRDNNYPPRFETMCINCNFGRYKNGGVCPHKTLAKKQVA